MFNLSYSKQESFIIFNLKSLLWLTDEICVWCYCYYHIILYIFPYHTYYHYYSVSNTLYSQFTLTSVVSSLIRLVVGRGSKEDIKNSTITKPATTPTPPKHTKLIFASHTITIIPAYKSFFLHTHTHPH